MKVKHITQIFLILVLASASFAQNLCHHEVYSGHIYGNDFESNYLIINRQTGIEVDNVRIPTDVFGYYEFEYDSCGQPEFNPYLNSQMKFSRYVFIFDDTEPASEGVKNFYLYRAY